MLDEEEKADACDEAIKQAEQGGNLLQSAELLLDTGQNDSAQASNLFALIHYLQQQESSTWKSKPGGWPGVLCGSVQSVHFEHFEGYSEHGIFHGIYYLQQN